MYDAFNHLTVLSLVRVNCFLRVRVITTAVFALLFAQLSVAAYACPLPATAAAEEAMTDCEGMASRLDPSSPNLCADHCQYGQQTDQLRTPTVPAVSLISLYVVPHFRL